MTWRDFLPALVGSGMVSAAVSAVVMVWVTSRQARNAEELLSKQQSAEWQRFERQLVAERERLQAQWEREQQDRLRTEAVAILEQRLNRVEAYCRAATETMVALVGDDRGKVGELAWSRLTPLLSDALVAAHQLGDQPIIKSLHVLADAMQAALSTPETTQVGEPAGEPAYLELIAPLTSIQGRIDKTRWQIRKNPLTWLEPVDAGASVEALDQHTDGTARLPESGAHGKSETT